MALLTYQQIAATGLEPTFQAAAASDTIQADPRGFYWVEVGATATNVTLVVPGSEYGQPRADVVINGLQNERRLIGPLVPDLADPSTGLVTVQTSQQTAVTVAAVRV